MQTVRRHANPFALMIDPQAVIAQVASSRHLEQLQRRVCRPLDKPLLGAAGEGEDDAANSAGLSSSAGTAMDVDHPHGLPTSFPPAAADSRAMAPEGGTQHAADPGN